MKNILSTSKLYGTNTERLAMNLSENDIEIHFYETDTNNNYKWKGSEWEAFYPQGTLGTLLAGEDVTNDVFKMEQQFEYETVAAGQTTQALGLTGAVGDLLHSIIITTSTNTITVYDGGTTVAVIPAAATGVWLFDLVSVVGAWNITTGASTSCTATGRFS